MYKDVPKLTTWKSDTSDLRKSTVVSILFRLGRLDSEIDKFSKAFVSMTKRNLLTDISYLIHDWEKIPDARVSRHAKVLDLKEVVERKIKQLAPPAQKYRKVFCLAYNAECNDAADEYFRFDDNDKIDMEKKCSELMQAIRQAYASVLGSGDDSDETLKVFMAPEFYFRGKNGAYSYDLVSQIIPEMKKKGTDETRFRDWLFIFGTAIAASEDVVSACTICRTFDPLEFKPDPKSPLDSRGRRQKTIAVCKVDPSHKVAVASYGAEVQNVALIQKGTDTHTVVKEYVSTIDYRGGVVGVTRGTAAKPVFNTRKAIASAGSNESRIKSKYQDERMGGGVFTIDGITFGMEICLDHIKSTGSGGRLEKYTNTIQILLIPSYGMEIGGGHYCVDGGIIFNVDGRIGTASEVVVKGYTGKKLAFDSVPAPKIRGAVESWGPYDIARRG